MSNKYVTIDEEMTINIKEFGDIKLEKAGRIRWGKGNLRDIKWYEYKIVECENVKLEELEYDCIILSFTRITKDILDEAIKTIVKEGVSKANRPNIDGNTGNIHSSNVEVKEVTEKKIEQLVLCKNKGPSTVEFLEADEYYCYNVIHKACYYPLISEKNEEKLNEIKSNYRYKLLEKVWEKLEGKTIDI